MELVVKGVNFLLRLVDMERTDNAPKLVFITCTSLKVFDIV